MHDDGVFGKIDTPGGHMMCCILLILLGCVMYKLSIPKAEDLIVGASAVIFASMRGKSGDTTK